MVKKIKSPKIGVALGSGSARGWAHIGILRELEVLGIKPDVVCGCSAGALVGGVYAAGSLNELEAWALSLDWKEVISFFDIKLMGGGVIMGDRLFNFFREHVGGNVTIESLPILFGSVATVLETGREVWLQNGLLFDAIRASMSLPGVIQPVSHNNQWLVDGGLVNPVPVSMCRAMGAEIIIAVNLNSDIVGKHFYDKDSKKDVVPTEPAAGKEEITISDKISKSFKEGIDSIISHMGYGGARQKAPGLFDVLAGTINIMQDRITRSRMAGDPPDIILEPRLSHLGLMEFYRAEEAISEGRKCVLRMRDAIDKFF